MTIRVKVLEVLIIQQPVEWQPYPWRDPVLILLDEPNERVLPILIGFHEAQGIIIALEQIPLPRPTTLNFMHNVLSVVGASMESVTVTKVADNTYHAITSLRLGDTIYEVDSRPSDAVGLAITMNAPIYVAEEVLADKGILMGKWFKMTVPQRQRGKVSEFHQRSLKKLVITTLRRCSNNLRQVPPTLNVAVFKHSGGEQQRPQRPTQKDLDRHNEEVQNMLKALISQ